MQTVVIYCNWIRNSTMFTHKKINLKKWHKFTKCVHFHKCLHDKIKKIKEYCIIAKILCRRFSGTISSVTLSHWNSSGVVLQPRVLPQWNTDREQLSVCYRGILAVQIFDSFLAALGPKLWKIPKTDRTPAPRPPPTSTPPPYQPVSLIKTAFQGWHW